MRPESQMSPRLLVLPFMPAAAPQSIKTNQQRQIQNKGLGKKGWGIGNNLPPQQRSANMAQVWGSSVPHKHQSSGSSRSELSGRASDSVSFSSIILPDHDWKDWYRKAMNLIGTLRKMTEEPGVIIMEPPSEERINFSGDGDDSVRSIQKARRSYLD